MLAKGMDFIALLLLNMPISEMKIRCSCGTKFNNENKSKIAWDDENIDHWKPVEWKPEYMSSPLLEEVCFSCFISIWFCLFSSDDDNYCNLWFI